MKKLFFIAAISFFVVDLQAQINVGSNNNFGIGTTNPLSKLSVGNDGNAAYQAFFYRSSDIGSSYNFGLGAQCTANAYRCYGISGSILFNTSANLAYGLYGSSYSVTPLNNGRAYGVVGYAGNATTGWNCAIYGQLAGSNAGAAIYGTVPGMNDGPIDNQYAGYFLGNVYVNGHLGINTSPSNSFDITTLNNIQVAGITVTSDQRLKDNIQNLSGALASLTNLKGVTYKLKQNRTSALTGSLKTANAATPDTGKVQASTPTIDTSFYNRNHIGFVAQDVQKVFPELVYADKDGTLSVDYVSLIPVLAESIKELSQKIDALAKENEELKRKISKKN